MGGHALGTVGCQHRPGVSGSLGGDHMGLVTQLVISPGHWVDPFTAGKHMAEVRLVAEPALQADLREAQGGRGDQLLGTLDALLADPFLGRQPGAALESARKMAARQGAGLGQLGDGQAFAEVGQDQLFGDAFAPRAQAASGGQARRTVLKSGHDRYPQSMGAFPVNGCSVDGCILGAGACA